MYENAQVSESEWKYLNDSDKTACLTATKQYTQKKV